MELGILLALISIGLTYAMWGYDKVSKYYKMREITEKMMGFFYFIVGILLIAFTLLVNFLSE